MFYVGLSTTTYDLDGARIIKQDPATERANDRGGRRVSRSATLDGGAVVTDTGYAAADRTYRIRARDDDGDLAQWAARIVQTYSTINIATRYGFFKGTPARWWVRDGFVNIEILITEAIG